MKCETHSIRQGYDKKRCLVHARCCCTSDLFLATAQYLNVAGCDLFSGLLSSVSLDGGKTWSEFKEEKSLRPIEEGNRLTVGCDATPMHHKKTDTLLLLGHTAEYEKNSLAPSGKKRYTFYSVFDKEKGEFGQMKVLRMPEGFENCGNGSGQSVELENGDILIPVYYMNGEKENYSSMAIRCSFDGENLTLLEMGNSLSLPIDRGLCEPSIAYFEGAYYMTLRNDQCGLVAKSTDGLNYTDLQLHCWENGELLQNYNTQQHWLQAGGELYLVYTRRGADNDHVFRHRAPLFAAKFQNMRLVRESEFALVKEQGARLGNFGVTSFGDDAFVMAAEWMQPIGCEKYGSDNNIFLARVTPN